MSTFRLPVRHVTMALVLALSVGGVTQGRAQAPGTAQKTALQLQMQAASASQAAAIAVCDYDVWLEWHRLYGFLQMMYRTAGWWDKTPPDRTYPFPCVPLAHARPVKPPGDAQYAALPATKPFEFFGGIEGGGGFNSTTFLTVPNFDVSGTGGLFGVNAGILVNIPGSTVSIGPRVGWIGSNMSGKTERPPASPFFDYEVKTLNAFYEEAFIRFAGFTPANSSPRPQDRIYVNYNYFVTASLGLAQVQNQVIGTSGAFRVTDTYIANGVTASIGLGMPVFRTDNGVTIDFTGQYRAIFLPQVEVQIPGKVANDFWTQGITFGLDFRY